MTAFVLAHPWMTFFLALAAIEAIQAIGVTVARRGSRVEVVDHRACNAAKPEVSP